MKKFIKENKHRVWTSNKDIFFFLILVLLFTFVGWRFIDPDYGWRLRTGEYILKNGLPETDIYTYTMSSFPWVDHAWPQDVVIYSTHEYLGKFFQTILWALAAFASLIISSKVFRGIEKHEIKIFGEKTAILSTRSYLHNLFFILGTLSLMNYFGVRVQVVTWLFFSIFIYLLFNRNLWLKYRNYLPLYFLIWANLHGGFASGLAAFFLFGTIRSLRERKVDQKDMSLFIASFLITLINPYGVSLWREVWSSISDSQLRWRIQEWMPFIFNPNWSTAFLMAMSSLFIVIYRKKFKLEEIALFFAFLIQALLSTRHVPLWVLVAIPLGTKAILKLYHEAIEFEHGEERFKFFYRILWAITILIFVAKVSHTGLALSRVDEGTFYPKSAVEFLKEQDYEGRLFSIYGWGGYLIWNYPEKKVYIDGRMPSWRWDADIPGETNTAVDDYFALIEGDRDVAKEIDKYDIQTILWRPSDKKTFWDIVGNKLNSIFSYDKEEKFEITKELEEIGWERVYIDKTAVIFRRP